MAKPGRNDPCPCGSGKKAKKCCSDRVATSTARPEVPHRPTAPMGWIDDDDLDDLSNRVVDLVAAGKLDEAERVCHDLRERYPEVYDWMERMGHVQEARGNYAEAARYYQQAADFIEGKDGYDPEVGAWLREQALALATRARSA